MQAARGVPPVLRRRVTGCSFPRSSSSRQIHTTWNLLLRGHAGGPSPPSLPKFTIMLRAPRHKKRARPGGNYEGVDRAWAATRFHLCGSTYLTERQLSLCNECYPWPRLPATETYGSQTGIFLLDRGSEQMNIRQLNRARTHVCRDRQALPEWA